MPNDDDSEIEISSRGGIFIYLRAYNKRTGLTQHMKGRGLRVYDWTPAEVQAILLRAFYEAKQELTLTHPPTTKGTL